MYKKRVNERYNEQRSFKLTWGREREKSLAVDKNKISKNKI
jgi:hypothetical protein